MSPSEKLAWGLLVISLIGAVVTVPAYLLLPTLMTERVMLLITLVLSWAALWYASVVAIQEARHAKERGDED